MDMLSQEEADADSDADAFMDAEFDRFMRSLLESTRTERINNASGPQQQTSQPATAGASITFDDSTLNHPRDKPAQMPGPQSGSRRSSNASSRRSSTQMTPSPEIKAGNDGDNGDILAADLDKHDYYGEEDLYEGEKARHDSFLSPPTDGSLLPGHERSPDDQ